MVLSIQVDLQICTWFTGRKKAYQAKSIKGPPNMAEDGVILIESFRREVDGCCFQPRDLLLKQFNASEQLE